MKDRSDLLDTIHQEVIKVGERVNEMKAEQAVLTHIVREHERRSLSLEKRQGELASALGDRLKPIEKHVDFVSLLLKALGAVFIAVLIKIVSGLLGIF